MGWITRWRYEVSEKPVRPGIWKLKSGGYIVSTQVTDARGRRRTVQKVLKGAKLEEAQSALVEARRDARRRLSGAKQSNELFADFAVDLLERKLRAKDIKSAKGEEKWRDILGHHLVPRFGHLECREIRHSHVTMWRDELARKIGESKLSPTTGNTWLSVLRVISKAMVAELELDRDPCVGLRSFDTTTRPTYTDEAPNALTAKQTRAFLEVMAEKYPQFHAMAVLGFATGLRPSSLRPLRRSGSEADVDLETGVLRVRRSNSLGKEIMNTTKTGRRQTIHMPPELVAILKAHVEAIEDVPENEQRRHKRMRESVYLFPSVRGGMRSRSVLDRAFEDVRKQVGVTFEITPRAMRRTFQDLARAAEVHDVVARSISGHATERMQEHYSTAQADEQRAGLAKVVQLFAQKKEVRG